MTYHTIMMSLDGPVATLTFNRPEKLNALNAEMLQEVTQALAEIQNEPAVRVLILTGQGRAFVAGADVRQFLEFDSRRAYEFARQAQEVVRRLEALPIPVIAAVNGFALGGGCEIALACDLIYASEKATFGQPEINLGLMPGIGGSQRLARLVGKGLAKDLCLTGRAVSAAEALAMGLAARVFPAASLLPECRRLALELATKSRFALAQIKQVINLGFNLDLPSALEMETQAFGLCFASSDPQEGVKAFLEKRPPQFSS
ncbi:MAG: enoyl-CoA hydratase/isomerase family protein [Desulfobacca sp.]|uniref:enoyl-CoA hydratase/isomerase family protein n=1 Tax=Desulfobacca sp. TaxID=2067990 RepID=UPI00404AE11D